MPRKKSLTEYEKGQVIALRGQGLSWRQIGRNLNRTHNVCKSFFENQDNYGQNHKGGRRPSLSTRTKNLLVRSASNKLTSAARLKEEYKLNVSSRTIQRILKASPNLAYAKMKKKPALTKSSQNRRLNWCKEQVKMGENWLKVIFSDEKKFNLDGPDGLAYYWHDLRKEKLIFSKRQQGGGGVMVWTGFSSEGKLDLHFCTRRMNSEEYINILESRLLPFWLAPDKSPRWFQQDNASIHTSNLTRQWFDDHAMLILGWPANSPDLNPMENLWGIMAKNVYKEGRHFGTVEELKLAIVEEWRKISPDLILKLARSMNTRVADVIYRHGRHLDN